MFSTLTANAGRFGTVPPLGGSPVSGHTGGGGGRDAPGLETTFVFEPPPVQEANATSAANAATIRAPPGDDMREPPRGIGGW